MIGTGPEPPPPWPKFHEYVSEEASSSVDDRPSKVQTFCAQDTVAFATGGRFAGWVTVMPVTVCGSETNPCWSVARTATEYTPAGMTGEVYA